MLCPANLLGVMYAIRLRKTGHMAREPPRRQTPAITSAVPAKSPSSANNHSEGNCRRAPSACPPAAATRKIIVGFRSEGDGITPALELPHDVAPGAAAVADEVTNVNVNATAAPGVIATGHGLNEHVANNGRFDGHWNFTISPFCPNTLSGTTIALNVAVPPTGTFTSSLCPLASCRLKSSPV